MMDKASMRPGQLTPENEPSDSRDGQRHLRFNEAGAINPGKPRTAFDSASASDSASMRPGQLTPENFRMRASSFKTSTLLQ